MTEPFPGIGPHGPRSAAVAKTVRRSGLQFVAVTWRRDVLDWLEPDWVIEVGADGQCHFQTNQGPRREAAGVDGQSRRWVRPGIDLRIVRSDSSAWALFKPHHYLSGELHRASSCFVGYVGEGRAAAPAVFSAVISFPHPVKPSWREHRTVCLPE